MPSVVSKIDRASDALMSRYRTEKFFIDARPAANKCRIILYVAADCPFDVHRSIEGFPVIVRRREV